MRAKLFIFSIALMLFFTNMAFSQTFTYSYTDPCTGNTKSLQVPSNGVTVTYYGQVNTFQPADFYNGNFETWAGGVFSSFGNNNPCASIVGLPTSVNIAQNTAINFLGTVNSLSALADLAKVGSTDMLSTGTTSAQSSSSNNQEKKNGSKSNNGSSSNNQASNASGANTGGSNGQSQAGNQSGATNGNTGTTSGTGNAGSTSSSGSQTGGTQGSSTESGGTGQSTGTGNGTQGSGTGQGSGVGAGNEQTTTGASTESSEEAGKTNLVGNSVSSIGNSTNSGGSSSPSDKNGNRPTILASSDFVGFNFQNSDVTTGGKVTGGYTSMRWDGARAFGITADYTTALKGPNITGFYAFIKEKRIDLISGTLTVGFDSKMSIYGTLALGQMWNITKDKKLKAVYMLTGSYGSVFGTEFIGTAAIAGGMYDWKISKRIDMKLMGLYVYAPYVSYYNDILLKSPHVVLPIVGTNVKLTKRFMFNINAGGAWALKDAALNYTIMMGTRMLL